MCIICAVATLAKKPILPVDWRNLTCAAGIDDATALSIKRRVDQFKDDMVAWLSTPAQDGVAPVMILAESLEQQRDDMISVFTAYSSSHCPAGKSETYLSIVQRQEQECCADIAVITGEHWETLRALAPQSLHDWPTGYSPLDQILVEVVEENKFYSPMRDGFLGDRAAVEDKSRFGAGRFCPNPFEYAQVDPDGSLFLCCPAMLFRRVGNLGRQTMMEAWNSPVAQEVRRSILDQSFRYCMPETCGALRNGLLPRVEEVKDPEQRLIIDEQITALASGPRTINFAYDQTCNLVCPSCRCEKIVLRGDDLDFATKVHFKVLGPHLKDARRLQITGSGDPFVSKNYLHFLRTFDPAEHPQLRIQISTNGLLFTPAMWETICHDAIDWVDVSIDAATPDTYAKNRGGNFERLLQNLNFIGSLRRSGEINTFNLHFVVQANNYKEMPAFAALGRHCGCDEVIFKQVQNWGTYAALDYAARAVQAPEHPEHLQFLGVLLDSALDAHHVRLHDFTFWEMFARLKSLETLPLTAEQGRMLVRVVTNYKARFVAIASQLGEHDTVPPIRLFAEEIKKKNPNAHAKFMAYASAQHIAGSGKTYVQALLGLDQQTQAEIHQIIPEFAADELQQQFPTLLQFPTLHDPLKAALAR